MGEVRGNRAVEDAAVAWVMELERQAGRNPVDTRYDSRAPADLESPPRKAKLGISNGASLGLD
jgi:hypothetical protein